jgi:hypothetical protein
LVLDACVWNSDWIDYYHDYLDMILGLGRLLELAQNLER